MQVTDPFEIGSITKSFTAVLALQLQEEGVWSLDDPLSQWLPEMAAQVPNGDQMTLRQLTDHTIGIWDDGDPILEAGTSDADVRRQAFTPEELIAYALENGQSEFDPGRRWSYSNTNYILLGMALESATSQSLADLYHSCIFPPLGLRRSHDPLRAGCRRAAPQSNPMVGTIGGTLGYSTLFMAIPEKDINLVYLATSQDCGVALLAAAVNESLLGEKAPL